MYNINNKDILCFVKRHAIIDYSKTKKDIPKKHCLALIAFLISKYNHENDKNDIEFIRIFTNLYTWLDKANWNNLKLTIRLPENILKEKWSNDELSMMSNHIEKSIKSYNKYLCLSNSVKLDNPFGLVEWIINVLELKFNNNQNLREIIKLFMDFGIF
jgi:hypothetical protein